MKKQNKEDMTMIRASKKLTKRLKDCKVHRRESYEDVINRALDGEAYLLGDKGGRQ